MRAALAYALRRTSARVALALGVGCLAFWLSQAVFDRSARAPLSSCGPRTLLHHALCADHGVSPPWDLGVVALTVAVALIAGAALYRRVSKIA